MTDYPRGLIHRGIVLPGTERVVRVLAWDGKDMGRDLRSRRGAAIDSIVYHWTGGPFRDGHDAALTGPAMIARKRPDGEDQDVSAHVVIATDGTIVQLADLEYGCVHAGTAQIARSVGVEAAWPGYASQAAKIRAQLARKGRAIHPAYDAPPETRTVRGRRVLCVPPPRAMLDAAVWLGEVLAAQRGPAWGVQRRISAAGPGAREHADCAPYRKLDATGYFLDALSAAGWTDTR